MSGKRERVLDAAIEVLGTRGLRGLTHRAVDEVAGIPQGSTSNYFRTRESLLEAVVALRMSPRRLSRLRAGVAGAHVPVA